MPEILRSQLLEGVWTGEIAGLGNVPDVQIFLGNDAIDGVEVGYGENDITSVKFTVPHWALADGYQNFVLRTSDGIQMGILTLIAGNAVADDLRAEIGLLRAELDMLKKAFRQHVLQTQG